MNQVTWYRMEKKDEKRGEVLIYDRIGQGFFDDDGVGAKNFAKDLKAMGELSQLDIRINSPGGSVFEGLAIYNQLRAHAAVKTVYVDGLAASIASVIAMAGDEIIMPSNALMMIHDPAGFAMGTAADFEKMVDTLNKIKEVVVNVYTNRSGLDREKIEILMSEETWMTASEAVLLGFATHQTEAVKVAASFDLSMYRNSPDEMTSSRDLPDGAVPGFIGGGVMPRRSQPTEVIDEIRSILERKSAPVKSAVTHTQPEGLDMTEQELQAQLSAARAEGRQEESARVLGILNFQAENFPDMTDVAVEAIRNGIDLETATKAMKNRQFLKVTSSAPASAGGGSEEIVEPTEPKNTRPNMEGWTVEQCAEWTWDNDAEIRNEFRAKGAYLAFAKADADGRVKILKK